MRKALLTLFTSALSVLAIGQNQNNIFKSYEDYKSNQPSENVEFQLQKRTEGNVFMTGGITNYRLKKINPKSKSDEMTKQVWGVFVTDSVYINSYPYSEVIGYNKIIDNGYYSYFIGEPARLKDKQISFGMINPDDRQKEVCCKTSYVILPNGEVKWLTPELLRELINDNQELSDELKNDKILQEDANEMFEYLKRYNEMK